MKTQDINTSYEERFSFNLHIKLEILTTLQKSVSLYFSIACCLIWWQSEE